MKNIIAMCALSALLAGCLTTTNDEQAGPTITDTTQAPNGDAKAPDKLWPVVECDTWKDCPDPPSCYGPACVEHKCQFDVVPDGNLCSGGMCIDGNCVSTHPQG